MLEVRVFIFTIGVARIFNWGMHFSIRIWGEVSRPLAVLGGGGAGASRRIPRRISGITGKFHCSRHSFLTLQTLLRRTSLSPTPCTPFPVHHRNTPDVHILLHAFKFDVDFSGRWLLHVSSRRINRHRCYSCRKCGEVHQPFVWRQLFFQTSPPVFLQFQRQQLADRHRG